MQPSMPACNCYLFLNWSNFPGKFIDQLTELGVLKLDKRNPQNLSPDHISYKDVEEIRKQ